MVRGTEMKGTVDSVRPVLKADRLKVVAQVRTEDGAVREAYMPDRELSAVLPRSILPGSSSRAPRGLLSTMEPILARMTQGRVVRVWTYGAESYFSFQPWRTVRFTD
jgi:hypothetical protein